MNAMRLLLTRAFSNHFFLSRFFWLGVVVPMLLLGVIYSKGIAFMVHKWTVDENYGHGFFVPIISLALVWQRRDRLREVLSNGSWWGVFLLLIGVGLYFVGELATLYVLVHLSLWIVLIGLVLAAIGAPGAKVIAFPLFFLLTMIPLPDFLYQGLSGRLQLISSVLGVGCLQWVGVTAFRDGNVIDLGPIQLQVVEACSGLRYLFPLATLALICAYLFQDRFWKRAVLFLSSFPIAIFLNGFRIGMTGLLVEFFGKSTAEGFFHDFSGWLLFVVSLVILFGEAACLSRIGQRQSAPTTAQDSRKHSVFSLSETTPPASRMALPYLFSLALLTPVLFASLQIDTRNEISPPRTSFSDFPMQVKEWEGKTLTMEAAYRETLRFDDYLLADYRKPAEPPLNF